MSVYGEIENLFAGSGDDDFYSCGLFGVDVRFFCDPAIVPLVAIGQDLKSIEGHQSGLDGHTPSYRSCVYDDG